MKPVLAADRVFAACVILLLGLYGYFAFFEISAPIQYDPLGPEGWPKFLTTVALLLCFTLLRNPQARVSGVNGDSVRRVFHAAAMLAGYAFVFEWLGFALATAAFCTGMARLLGTSWFSAVLFGTTAGAGLYGVAVYLLGLNLPPGEVFAILRSLL
jgi:putative tricarboxylic transport membrane protein